MRRSAANPAMSCFAGVNAFVMDCSMFIAPGRDQVTCS